MEERIEIPITISLQEEIPIIISLQEEVVEADFGEVSVIHSCDLPIYDGDYIVTPKAEEQELETANKILTDNVTVLEIPYTEVSNISGGLTVSIA